MGDRRQKRTWLRLVGAVVDNAPSGSVEKTLTPSLVDSTLGSIQDDNVWVAMACLDAIENKAEVTLDLILTRHLIRLGIERTNPGKSFDLESKQTKYSLAIRKMLVRYERMVDIWDQVYSADGGQKVTDDAVSARNAGGKTDEGEDFDAWDDTAKESDPQVLVPPTEPSLIQFIRQPPLQHIRHLASTAQMSRLKLFIEVMPAELLTTLFPHRLEIAKELLLSTSAHGIDPEVLRSYRLLPDIVGGKESDLWTDRKQLSQGEEDISDNKQICDVLSSCHLLPLDDTTDSSVAQIRFEDSISPDRLLEFYASCIDSLEKQPGSSHSSSQLANMIMSDEFNLQADENFTKLSEDLALLHPLNHGTSSSRSCSSWTLQRFREELNARPELFQRQVMATLYLEEATSDSDAIKAARQGAIPFIRIITQRYSQQTGLSRASDKVMVDGFLHTILALADRGRVNIARPLTIHSAECGAEIGIADRAKVALACLLGSSHYDAANLRQMEELIATTLLTLDNVTLTGNERPLREVLGVALSQLGHPLPPSQLRHFLAHVELPDLRYYIQQCRMHLDFCQRFAKWNSTLTISWLFSAQGLQEEQTTCINRIVRSFAREHKSTNQWSIMTQDLLVVVGSGSSFDALNEKAVIQLIIEGALRTGDEKIYSFMMKEQGKRLSHEEQEVTALNASREFYDNSTSTNVHQGDMKTAYEILMHCRYLNSTRIEQEIAFIEATSRLCSFRIQSMLRPGAPLSPIEIRLSTDRIDLIKRLLETKEDAYKSPDLILDLAQKLCAVPEGLDRKVMDKMHSRPLIESRTLALLIEAALGHADFESAQSSCQRLVANVATLEKRVEQSAVSQAKQHIHLQKTLLQVRESAYRSCFLLSNQPEWKEYGSRLTWCSYVLAYCPSDQIERYLKTWRQLEENYQEDLINNPPKDWDSVAIQLKSTGSAAGGLASSLASIGALGTLESLSPFGTLFSSARNTATAPSPPLLKGAHHDQSSNLHTSKDDALQSSPSSRAARLFDSLGGGSTHNISEATYLDPAERAARAARRFFGGFG